MKQISLNKMQLTNFKGLRQLDIEFGASKTIISGRNATGKSTVFDAFTWCLFGKDSHGATTFNIKTLGKDGKAIEKIMHEVSVHLTIADENRTETRIFTRQIEDKWVKKHGSEEATLDGNDYHYFCDGLEMSKTAFDSEVRSIVDEQTFRAITNTGYFFDLTPDEQRTVLATLVGQVTDEEILVHYPELRSIVEEAHGHDMNYLKNTVNAKVNNIKKELDSIPAQIQAIDSVTPEMPDAEELEQQTAKANEEMAQIDKAIANEAERSRQQNAALTELRKKVNTLRGKQQDIIYAERRKAEEEYQNADAERAALKRDIAQMKENDDALHQSHVYANRRVTADIAQVWAEVRNYEQRGEELLKRWDAISEREYKSVNGTLVCPISRMICQTPAVLAKVSADDAAAREAFIKKQDDDLNVCEAEIAQVKASKEQALQQIGELKKKLDASIKAEQQRHSTAAAAITIKEQMLDGLKEPTRRQVVPEKNAEWCKLDTDAKHAEAELNLLSSDNYTDSISAYDERKRELIGIIERAAMQRQWIYTIEKNNARIEEIKQREKELVAQLGENQKKQYQIECYTKARLDTLEALINSHFKVVRFKFYQEQLNKGERLTCIATVDGVPYRDLNTAARTNAALDIINAIATKKGVTAPIFIDNAEGINTITTTLGQQVHLTVTDEDKLTIKNC